MSPRTRPCDDALIAGRMAKAEQFLEAAETVRDFADDEHEVGDAYVTLCVHAGIAAADVLSCVALGRHALGDDHSEAVALLASVRPSGRELARALGALLAMKTRAGYSARPVAAADRTRAERQAQRLVHDARERRASR
jgi:hypothetical protein